MKKIFALLGAIIMIMTVLISCSKGEYDAPDGFTYATNDGCDYVFFYPFEWTLERNDAGMISVYASESDFSNVSVTAFTWNSEFSSLSEYVEKYYFKQFENNFSNLKYTENEDGTVRMKVTQIDGCDAVVFEYSALFGQENYMFKTAIISFNGYIYTVTYTATEEKYESHIEVVNTIIDNFIFKH